MAKSPKVVKLEVVPVSKMHYQDLVDYHFDKALELIAAYCAVEDQDAVDMLDQSYYRLHEAQDWWERWKTD